jgi:hypothetical protein
MKKQQHQHVTDIDTFLSQDPEYALVSVGYTAIFKVVNKMTQERQGGSAPTPRH